MTAAHDIPLSSGEVHFLWWFIQGSIMNGDTRSKMHRAWGLCDRHTAAWLTVEAAFRHGFFHGPAVLYADLMERAVAAFEVSGPLAAKRVIRRLRSQAGCHICAAGLGPASQGYIETDRLQLGRDVSQLRAFMAETAGSWHKTVCSRCIGTHGVSRCREHLVTDLQRGRVAGLEHNRSMVRQIADHMARFHKSFHWEYRDTETVEDRAALISAAGWCSGWRGLLALYHAM